MKALLYKEFKLAMHPICYVFIAMFPLMILIPSYPIAIGFIYVLTCYPILFLGANKGQQSNDLLYSTLLPIRKKDIVIARIMTVVIMHLAFVALTSALYPIAVAINNSITESAIAEDPNANPISIPGLGLNSYVLILAIVFVGFAIADLIFFPIYYKNGKSIVMSTLMMIIGFVIYLGVFTIGLPYIPGLEWVNTLPPYVQFIALGVSLLIYAMLHFVVFKVSSKRLEKVDF